MTGKQRVGASDRKREQRSPKRDFRIIIAKKHKRFYLRQKKTNLFLDSCR